MKERMDAIWEKAAEKHALQEAARRLLARRDSLLGVKLSVSLLGGLAMALLPVAGAAQALGGVM